jgi:hypothetical protein
MKQKGKDMKKTKFFTLLVTALSVLALTGTAFAAGAVSIQTTVPNIPKSICEQAGTITMSADNGTAIHTGDVVEYTLNNNVTVCKEIDFFLAFADEDGEAISTNTADPVHSTGPGGTFTVVAYGAGFSIGLANELIGPDGDEWELGFRVKASDGDQIVTCTFGRRKVVDNGGPAALGEFVALITGDGFDLTFTPGDVSDLLNIKLFDKKTTAGYFYEESDPELAPNVYDEAIEEEDNVLCIDTLTDNFTGEYVYSTPDSKPLDVDYKWSFNINPQIAHILAAQNYAVSYPCKHDCPQVAIDVTYDQYGNPIDPPTQYDPGDFDSGVCGVTNRWDSVSTCDTSEGVGVLAYNASANLSSGTQYFMTLEILVNGETSTDAVWSGAGAVGYWTDDDDHGNCRCTDPAPAAIGEGWTLSATDTLLTSSNFTSDGSTNAVMVDLPPVDIDYEDLNPGDEITVVVSFMKFPCGTLVQDEICIGRIVSECPSVASDCYKLTFPYTVGAADASWWGGVALTNLTDVAGDATITFYDMNGGNATYDVSVGAHQQSVFTLSSIEGSLVMGSPALNTSVGGYFEVECEFLPDGILMLGDYAFGQLHGYIPRVQTCDGENIIH